MPIYKVYNRRFFKRWSSEMSYILGFLFADGNIIKTKRETYFTSLYSRDLGLLRKIRSSINSNHKVSKRNSKMGSWYRMQIGSRELFKDLQDRGLLVHKAKRMRLPKIPNKYLDSFIRGYFDGDGNVWVGQMNKKRPNPGLGIQVSFTSCGARFLKDLHLCLKRLGLTGGSFYELKSKNCSRLSFSTLDSLKLYGIMYNKSHELFLSRKKLVFDKFIKMRP